MNDEVVLEICPHCGEKSWWLNPYTNEYECMNTVSCPTNSKKNHSVEHHSENINYPKNIFSNPMLLSVKMFLADVIQLINKKYTDNHVCADFAQEVYDAATEREIRCGYVIIYFAETDIAHAIVAFETDYGLKYFEPQSADEEDVTVGRRYSTRLKGIPEDNIITKIEITWNDGGKTVFD